MNLFFSALCILLTLSNMSFPMSMCFSKHDDHEIKANAALQAILNYSKKMKKEKNIALAGYGLIWAGPDKIYDRKIHEIDIGYRIDKNMQYDEARKLFYSLVDGLIEHLNQNDFIQDCFYHHPISYQDFYIRLSFDYEGSGHLKRNDIEMIAILENKIMYFVVEKDGEASEMKTKQLTPDVQIVTDFSPKTRCITRKLPEKDPSQQP